MESGRLTKIASKDVFSPFSLESEIYYAIKTTAVHAHKREFKGFIGIRLYMVYKTFFQGKKRYLPYSSSGTVN